MLYTHIIHAHINGIIATKEKEKNINYLRINLKYIILGIS